MREEEEQIGSKSRIEKVIETESLAEGWRAGNGDVDGVSRPTWANNSRDMRAWLKGPACPKSAQLLVGGREEDQSSPDQVQVLDGVVRGS